MLGAGTADGAGLGFTVADGFAVGLAVADGEGAGDGFGAESMISTVATVI